MQHSNEKIKKLIKITGTVIKRLRERKGFSLNIFAYENDLQKSLISRLENGTNDPKLSSIWKISQSLGVKPSDLLRKVESELPENFSLLDD